MIAKLEGVVAVSLEQKTLVRSAGRSVRPSVRQADLEVSIFFKPNLEFPKLEFSIFSSQILNV